MWLEAKSCVQARKWRAWWRGGGRGGQVEDDIVYLMCQVARRRTWWPSRYEGVYLMWLEARRRTWWPSWKMKAFGSQLWFTKKQALKMSINIDTGHDDVTKWPKSWGRGVREIGFLWKRMAMRGEIGLLARWAPISPGHLFSPNAMVVLSAMPTLSQENLPGSVISWRIGCALCSWTEQLGW